MWDQLITILPKVTFSGGKNGTLFFFKKNSGGSSFSQLKVLFLPQK